MNNDSIINDCVNYLINNYNLDTLLSFVRCDDGADTICDSDNTYNVNIVDSALDIIGLNNGIINR